MGQTKHIYAYIAAPSRSGSTMLAILLNTHPLITSVGELRPVCVPGRSGRPSCSCGKEIEECEFWRRVEEILQRDGRSYFKSRSMLDWDSLWSRLEFYPLSSRLSDAARRKLFALFSNKRAMAHEWSALHFNVARAALKADATTVFVDGSKSFYLLPILATHPGMKELFDFRVIHLVRDVRGVAASMVRNLESGKRLAGCKRVAKYWMRNHTVVERFCQRNLLPSEHLLFDYRKLCQDPEKELRRLSRFLNVEYDFQTRKISDDYHVHGNRMRRVGIDEIREDEKWRQELSAGEVASVERIAGEWNHKHQNAI